jgi:hypothetical protein
MVHADGGHRTGATIVGIFRNAGRRCYSGEQDAQPQSTQHALWLAEPEAGSRICGDVHGVKDCQTSLLILVKASGGGATIITPPGRDQSEGVVAHLGHHDVIVGLGCSADACESEALVIGILRADLDRPERAPENRVIKPDGVLSNL